MEAKLDRASEDVGNILEARACQRHHPGSEPRHALLRRRAGADARPLHHGQHQQHVDQCRPQPVPPADRQAAEPARHLRPSLCPTASDLLKRLGAVKKHLDGSKFAYRERQFLRRHLLALGQPHPLPLPRYRAIRPGQARHALYRVRGRARLGQGHRALLSRESWTCRRASATNGAGPAAHVQRRRRPGADLPRDRPADPGRMTGITSRSISATSRVPTRSSASSAWFDGRAGARIPLHRHHRSRHQGGAVPARARGPLEPASALWPAARQPQPGPDEQRLHAGP